MARAEVKEGPGRETMRPSSIEAQQRLRSRKERERRKHDQALATSAIGFASKLRDGSLAKRKGSPGARSGSAMSMKSSLVKHLSWARRPSASPRVEESCRV